MKDDEVLWILGGAFVLWYLAQTQKAAVPILATNLAANTQIANAQAIENAALAAGNAFNSIGSAIS